jgi:glycosyltransferase involved in cell wall biosynthesis
MKILHVINSPLIGGAEKLVRDLASSLNEDGVQTDILFLTRPRSVSFFDLNSGYKIIFPTFSFGFYNPFLVFYLIKHLKKYDVINVHLFPSLYLIAFIKMFFLRNLKIVFTEHSTENRRMNNEILRGIERIVYKNYDKIVTISTDVDRAIKAHLNFNEDKFILIQNGVDLNAIGSSNRIPRQSLSKLIDDSDFVITQVSSFQYPKDHFTVLEALAKLPCEIKCVFVGDGGDREICEKYVIKKKLESRVVFLGKRTDVYEIMKSSDVLVLSSRYEGMPVSCLESIASGKPFIGANVPGISEIIKGHGLLFNFSDSLKLAEHILNLYCDKNYYNSVANDCFLRSKNFDLSKTVNSYKRLYKTII